MVAGWAAAALALYMFVSGRGGREMAGWMVHGGCFHWDPRTMAVWITGNLGTAACYGLIPVLLRMLRRSGTLPTWILSSFETFILFCGTGHIVKVWTLWNADYAAAGVLDLATFFVSIPAAIGLGLTIWQAKLSTGVVSAATQRAEAAEKAREELLERLQESNDDLERFAYAASHDLQEPLRLIRSYADLVVEDYADAIDDEGRHFLTTVTSNADRAQALVEELLAFSRLSNGGEDHALFPLRDALDEATARLELLLSESRAELVVGDLPEVRGESTQIALVFQNLLTNAVRYAGDGPPRIEVRARRHGARWQIEVLDEGIGVPAEKHEAIFEPFKRLHAHGDIAGTGLGLAMCRRVVERHGGTIRVAEGEGGRTCFRFDLAAAEES